MIVIVIVIPENRIRVDFACFLEVCRSPKCHPCAEEGVNMTRMRERSGVQRCNSGRVLFESTSVGKQSKGNVSGGTVSGFGWNAMIMTGKTCGSASKA